MSALTDYAKGKPCLIRLPGICTFLDEQTVPCHVPLMGYHGTGIKMDDWFYAFGCFNCHDACDRRRYKELEPTYVRICLLEGMIRTHAYILEHKPMLLANFAKQAA
jgi:hypothetical protein